MCGMGGWVSKRTVAANGGREHYLYRAIALGPQKSRPGEALHLSALCNVCAKYNSPKKTGRPTSGRPLSQAAKLTELGSRPLSGRLRLTLVVTELSTS